MKSLTRSTGLLRALRLEQLEDRRLLSWSNPFSQASDNTPDVPTFHAGPRDEHVPLTDQRNGDFLPNRHSFWSANELLTAPSTDDDVDIVIDFFMSELRDAAYARDDLLGHIITDQYTSQHTDVTHLYLRQTYDGLEIADANASANLTALGELINAFIRFIPGVHDGRVSVHDVLELDAAHALRELAHEVGAPINGVPSVVAQVDYDPTSKVLLAAPGLSPFNILGQLHYVPTREGIELAWRFEIVTTSGDHWYNASVSAEDGRLLRLVDWVDHAQYNVFPLPLESPNDGPRSIVVDPHDAAASPFGWHDDDGVAGAEHETTRGNNVVAREDTDADDTNGALANGGATLSFDHPLDLTEAPSRYRDAAITNLFYWNNVLHDLHFHYGFDEAAGNFQQTNYTDQGEDTDPVFADAQDGFWINNATMATPPDGQSPRMEMYLWENTQPSRDSDLDSGVIIHEYGHGVSNRLTGGPSNADALNAIQSASLGEGWSDWWSLMLTQTADDQQEDSFPLGAYSEGLDEGIRRHPYSFDLAANPITFGDFNFNNEVHDAGEIWASALWDLNWLLIDKHGFDEDSYHGSGGNNLAMQLVMDGLKLQPDNPSFIDARDAILAADKVLTDGENQREMWTAFARRGLGYEADDGGGSDSTTVRESFEISPGSQGTLRIAREFYELDESIEITLLDGDLTGSGSVEVRAVTTDGSTRFVTLVEGNRLGVFRGSVNLRERVFDIDDPDLQAQPFDSVLITYADLDDGAGNSIEVEASTQVVSFVDLLDVNFERGDGTADPTAFEADGNGSQWHLSDKLAEDSGHSVPYAFHFGAVDVDEYYADNSRGTLTTPMISLIGVDAPATLTFQHYLETDGYGDIASIRIVRDGESAVVADNMYVGGLTESYHFEPVHIDLTEYVGQEIRIQFEFESDEYIGGEGWHIDDLLIRAIPRPLATIVLDATAYTVGDRITVSITDAHLVDETEIETTVRATTGDTETIVLQQQGGGLFRGSISTSSNLSDPFDGMLSTSIGERIRALFVDLDDGHGVEVEVQDSAIMTAPPIEIFRANFDDDDDEFGLAGSVNEWHLTSARANDPGHGGGRSFYFGHGESEDGNGSYYSLTDGSLVSPTIDLVQVVGNATLEFNSWLLAEAGYDIASVRVGWGKNFLTEIASSMDSSIPNTGRFETIRLDLSPFIGYAIRVFFEFRSDIYTLSEGWYIDDVVVSGMPPGPNGNVRFDYPVQPSIGYETGDLTVVTVSDSHLVGEPSFNVTIRSDGGDRETIRLREYFPGVFRGAIEVGTDPPDRSNDLLEPTGQDSLSVSYFDDNEGTEVGRSRTAEIPVNETIRLIHAGFSNQNDDGDENGFESSGYANQWHISRGAWQIPHNDSGHEDLWTWYFGSGEGPSTRGTYESNSFGLLTSPPIDLSELSGRAILEFAHQLQNRNNDDLARILVVANGLATEIASSGFGESLLEFPGFRTVRLDITEYIGSEIQIQFEFSSDESDHEIDKDEGWYIDDVVVKGVPISPTGDVRLSSQAFELGQPIGVTVTDRDLAGSGSIDVRVESANGTRSVIELTETVDGRFVGEVTTTDRPHAEQGLIRAADGDLVTVTYVDAADRNGNEVVQQAAAQINAAKANLLVADFTGADGAPSDEGFSSSGRRDLWHVTAWTPDDFSHSTGGSFYFGANQQDDQPGNYFNFANGTLTSPVVDLGAMSSDITLSFNHFLQAEEFGDVATVSVLANGESILLASSDFFDELPISHRFIPVEFDLSAFAGEQIRIEFGFESDRSVTDIGWYIDDVVVRGVPVGSSGRVAFADDLFETNQAAGLQVADWDLRGQGLVNVIVTSQLGDTESIVLHESGPGIFRGDTTITSLASPETNGVLEIANRDNITVSYLDEINDHGVPLVISDTATATTLVDVFRADFQDEGGLPFSDGFQFAGDNNPWHVSVGRAIEDGHSPIGSFYFGRNEDGDGGGAYQNAAYGLLTSPLIDLREFYDEVFLEFNHVLDLRYDDDVARVLVSVNDERFEIASSAAFFFGNLHLSDEFSKVRMDISEFAGEQIRLHFEMSTDDARVAEGWYVDDVAVRALPAVPLVDLNGSDQVGNKFSTVFVEGDDRISIVSTDPSGPLEVIDNGEKEISGAVVRITDRRDGDLEWLEVDTGETRITVHMVDDTLVLEGFDSTENYEAVLRTVAYANSAEALDPSDRAIAFTLRSGLAYGEPVTSTVSFQFVDSGPVKVEDDLFRMERNSILEVTRSTHRTIANAVGYGIARNDVTHRDDLGDPTSIILIESPHDAATGEETGVLELNQDGTFSFTPPSDYLGTVEFTYRIDDGFQLYGPATVSIKVLEELLLPTISGLADASIVEDTPIEIPFSITDPNEMPEALVLSVTSSNQDILPDAGLVIEGTGAERRLVVAPSENQSGGPVAVIVTVGTGIDSVTESFQLTVNPVNDAPQLSTVADQTLDEDGQIDVLISVADVDTPAGELTVDVESDNLQLLPTANAVVIGEGTDRVLSLQPSADAFGQATLTLTVTDTEGATMSQSFLVEVVAVNDAPTISDLPDVATQEDTSIDIGFTVNDVDSNISALAVTVTSDNDEIVAQEGIQLDGTEIDRVLTIVPSANSSGIAGIAVTVEVDGGLSTTSMFQLSVEPVNDLPQIISMDSVQLNEGQLNALVISALDVDGDSLTFALTGGLDQDLFLVDSVSGQLVFQVAPDFESPDDSDANNVYELQVTVDDGMGGTASQIVLVEVTDVPETAPTAAIQQVTPDKRAASVEDVTFSFSIPIQGISADDLFLTHTRNGVDEIELAGVNLLTTDSVTWALSGLGEFTGEGGIYTLRIDSTRGNILGENGVPLASDATMTWINGAGDANGDNAFDQFDIILILQGAKYLAGTPATWAEGDWNGDGLFDQFDIIVAQQTQPAHYLTGRFNARNH